MRRIFHSTLEMFAAVNRTKFRKQNTKFYLPLWCESNWKCAAVKSDAQTDSRRQYHWTHREEQDKKIEQFMNDINFYPRDCRLHFDALIFQSAFYFSLLSSVKCASPGACVMGLSYHSCDIYSAHHIAFTLMTMWMAEWHSQRRRVDVVPTRQKGEPYVAVLHS